MKYKVQRNGVTLVELVIAIGICTIIIGASFSLMLTSRISVFGNEAAVQAGQNARKVVNLIRKELRLSKSSRVYISNNLELSPNNLTGSVIKFQIPVGVYDDNLQLDAEFNLQWGSGDTVGERIAYSIDGNNKLIRSTYSTSDGSDAVSKVVASGITAVSFSRSANDSGVIDFSVTAQGVSSLHTKEQILSSSARLRN